jgi:hypothetical protein
MAAASVAAAADWLVLVPTQDATLLLAGTRLAGTQQPNLQLANQ